MSLLSAEFPLRTVTAADADASVLSPLILPNAQAVRIGACCDTPGKTLVLSIYFLNTLGQPYCVQAVRFTSGAAAGWGKTYVGIPQGDPCWPLGGAAAVVIKVDSVSGGTWTIGGSSA